MTFRVHSQSVPRIVPQSLKFLALNSPISTVLTGMFNEYINMHICDYDEEYDDEELQRGRLRPPA